MCNCTDQLSALNAILGNINTLAGSGRLPSLPADNTKDWIAYWDSGTQKYKASDVTIDAIVSGNELANFVLAGPSAGPSAIPTYRALVSADIPNISWSKITSGTPTTLSGYGITDAYTKTSSDARYLQISNNLSEVNAASARTNLGLGTLAVLNNITLTGDVTGVGSNSINTTVNWSNGYGSNDTRYLQLSGGTITAPIFYSGTPTNANELVNMAYISNIITGLSWKRSVLASTAATLPSYVVSGSNTILTASANGILVVDTITPVTGDRILVKNESGGINNGIYDVVQGTVSTKWVLTRSSDSNTAAALQAATVYIRTGSTEVNRVYAVNSNPSSLTSSITYALISGAGTYTNGVGILLTGNVFSIDNTYIASGSQTGYLSSTNWTTFNNKVTSISGVSNRTTVTGTTTVPIVDISASYIGQSSITTLGTIISGTWQGTAIADLYISSATTWNAKQSAISLTNGSVMFYNGGVTQDNANFYFASHILSVSTNGDQAGTDSINAYNNIDAFAPNSANSVGSATSASHTVSSARGTAGSFTELTDSDYIGSFSFWPANGANSWTEGIALRGYVSGSTSTNRGTKFELWTKKDSGVTTKAFTVDNLQNMIFANTTANGLVANNITTTQKNALTGIAGAMVYDTVQTRQSFYNNGAWVNFVKLSGDTMSGSLNMGSNTVTNVSGFVLGTNDQIADVSGIGLAFGYNNNQSFSNAAFRNNKFSVTINAGSESSLGFTSADGGLAIINSIFSYSVASSTGTLTAGQNYLGNITLTNGGGAVTVTDWAGFRFGKVSVAASQTLTTLQGFRFEDQTSSNITNIYAVRSLLNAVSNRWGLYFDGTAQNTLMGNLGIKILVPQVELDVSGTAQFTGNIKNVTAGGGLYIKEGTNATMGVVTLVAGAATVATTKVTASSRIQLTPQTVGTVTVPTAVSVSTKTAGTGFTITSASAVDTSIIHWIIIEPS